MRLAGDAAGTVPQGGGPDPGRIQVHVHDRGASYVMGGSGPAWITHVSPTEPLLSLVKVRIICGGWIHQEGKVAVDPHARPCPRPSAYHRRAKRTTCTRTRTWGMARNRPARLSTGEAGGGGLIALSSACLLLPVPLPLSKERVHVPCSCCGPAPHLVEALDSG